MNSTGPDTLTYDISPTVRSWIEELGSKDEVYTLDEPIAGGARFPFQVKKVKEHNLNLRNHIPLGAVVYCESIMKEGWIWLETDYCTPSNVRQWSPVK